MCLKGRYGGFIGREWTDLTDYRAMIREVLAAGGDFVKIMITGIMDFNQYGSVTGEPLTPDLISELIRIAHGEGLAVMAHANGARTIQAALEAGVDSVEHGAYMDDEALRAMARSGAVWVPTLSTVGNLIGCGRYPDDVLERILGMQLENTARCAALGGTIALGSDAGAFRVYHAQAVTDEYNWLKRALGAGTDAVLAVGEARIRQRFHR